jgi:hypothetical protein
MFRGNLVYFSRFGILYQEKSGNPDKKDAPHLETLAHRNETCRHSPKQQNLRSFLWGARPIFVERSSTKECTCQFPPPQI